MPYGVSEQMIETWGEMIFDLSLNIQIRRGDPIRHLDHEAWLAQRDDMGLSDPEIAARLGLATEQVTFIRNILERRKFRLNQYRKLYRLGGGLRYRADRFIDPEEKFVMSDAAINVRQAIDVPAEEAARFIHDGLWTQNRIPDFLDQHAANSPESCAIVDAEKSLTWHELQNAGRRLAASLQAHDLGRGDIIASNIGHGVDLITCYLATLIAGGVFLPLPPEMTAATLAACLKRTGARAIICAADDSQATLTHELAGLAQQSKTLDLVIARDDRSDGENDRNDRNSKGILRLADLLAGNDDKPVTGANAGLAATDPALLLGTSSNHASLAVFSHQNLTSGADSIARLLTADLSTPIVCNFSPGTGPGSLAVHLALMTGRTLVTISSSANADTISFQRTDMGLEIRHPGEPAPPALEVMSNNQIIAALVRQNGDAEIWHPSRGVQARTINQNGCPALDGQSGKLQVRGPGLAVGHLSANSSGSTEHTLDGWHNTGLSAIISDRDISFVEKA